MSGNKTAHDLGLAAQSDIPTVPVQSVNGKTGAVTLGAGDVGFDESETYQSGTAGYALNDLSRQLSDKTTGLDTKAPVILETASGAIASFDDGADSMPIKKLVAQIEPVQDLHGYDYPWPAGGGKNLLDPSTRTVYSSGEGARWYETDGFVLKANQAYTFSVTYSNPISLYIIDKSSGNYLANGNQSVTYTPAEDTTAYFQAYRGENISGVDTFQLELGSTATAYSPYSNICPISGWTGAEIKNNYVYNNFAPGAFGDDYATYWDVYSGTGSVQDGILTVTNAVGRNGVKLRSNFPRIIGHKYYRSFSYKSTVAIQAYMGDSVTYQSSETFLRQEAIITAANTNTNYSFDTFPQNIGEIGTFSLKNIMMVDLTAMFGAGKEPSTVEEFRAMFPDEYYPYNDGTQPVVGDGSKISVTFPSAAGTVYGGTLTLNPDRTGTLVVDRAMVDLGTMQWKKISTTSRHWRFYATLNSQKIPSVLLCSQYQQVSSTEQYLGAQGIANQYSGNINLIMVCDERYSDVAAFQTAMSGVQVVYELATPQTYQLTAEQVSGILTALYGTNNIWADTGDVEVTYPADTKLYIDGKLAELQATILENIGG